MSYRHTHATVICKSHRVRDRLRGRWWVMCRAGDHEGPFPSLDEALDADRSHHRQKVRMPRAS